MVWDPTNTNALEEGRIAHVAPELERLLGDAFGRDELIAAGYPWWAIDGEVCVRAVSSFEIREAAVPPNFPIDLWPQDEGSNCRPDVTQTFRARRYQRCDSTCTRSF
jgi:hypothetical protein